MRYYLLLLTLFLAACGTAAEVRPTFEPTNTALPRAANVEAETETIAEVEVAVEPTQVPPTLLPTEVPPTATLVPTDAPVEATEAATEEHAHAEATEAATEEHAHTEATEAATEEHAHTEATEEAAAPEAVVVNGIEGNPEFGEVVFNGAIKVTYNGAEWQCSTCHNVNEPLPGSGPYLYGIGSVAAEHAKLVDPTMTAVDYLADSIMNPSHFIAPAQVAPDGTEYPWTDGVMPNNWGTVLSEYDVADLVAYLMTLTQAVDHGHEH